jgi:serine/threonine protein kinase
MTDQCDFNKVQNVVKHYGYNIRKCVGHGSFSDVFEATMPGKKELVALKIIDKNKYPSVEKFIDREIRCMKKVNGSYTIVNYLGSFDDSDYAGIAMTLCKGKDLWENTTSQPSGHLTDTQARAVFRRIAIALVKFDNKELIHGDVKLENIILLEPGNFYTSVLCDLGLSAEKDNYDELCVMVGTPTYAAPELFRYYPRSHKSDVWALGVCISNALTGESLFLGSTKSELSKMIINNKRSINLKSSPCVSNDAFELLDVMLQVNPDKRPTARECLGYNWLRPPTFFSSSENLQKYFLAKYC